MRQGRQVRVLFINDTARNGGPGRSLHSILKFLDPTKVHRCVVLPRRGPIADLLERDAVTDELRFEPGLVENPIEPWSRPMARGDYGAPAALKCARAAGNIGRVGAALARLARTVLRDRFDLVYCNGTNADFAGGAVAAATGVPALWHVRYTALPAIARRAHRALSASDAVSRILCVSRASARLFPHCESKVSVLHNGLDVDAFDPAHTRGTLRAELGLPPNAVVFGSHGRVLRRKGYLEMIAAARLALDAMPPSSRKQVFFVVVGDTPDDFVRDHAEECAAAVRSAGLGHHFRMVGFRSDIRTMLADFDVAVVPSVYDDPLPRAVMEALAFAKPVIAFGVGGVTEMLDDGVTGEVIPFVPAARGAGAAPETVARLARSFVAYAGDSDLRARQGAAARSRALERFDARDHARAVEAAILTASDRGSR